MTDLNEMTSSLLDGDFFYLDNIFRNIGSDSPLIRLNPTADDVESARLKSLFKYWIHLPRGQRLPLTQAIDAVEIGPALGIVMLLETTDDPYEFIYRLYGSEIATISGLELTGKTTAAISSPEMRTYFRITYAAAVRSGAPLFCHHRPPPAHGMTCWARLILPCEDGTGRIDRLLVGNEPGFPKLLGRRPWPDG
ncbi:PAS domain-containing protein [Thalassobaculum salexigens]|uniref:PAS domain-containing protein n=1 Tax=Thalassobaculum salexigens TaxID=455360 RepID=UPI00048C2440|nr:PAS domain-containing protein [Thalassobaculum salexigens]